MFIVGQTGEIIVNSDRVECFYEQIENGVPAIKARTQNVNVTLGLYRTKQGIDKAMADLGLALLAADARAMKAYMMRADDAPQEIKQSAGMDPDRPAREGRPNDGKQETTEPAGNAGMDGADGNGMAEGTGGKGPAV